MRKYLKRLLKKAESSAIIVRLLGFLIYIYAQLIGITTRWQKRGIDNIYKIWSQEKAFVLIIWHGRALMPCYFWHHKKQFPMSALVSPHRDGRLLAAVLRCFGIHVIDGSSNENACGAALSLMRELQKNHSITIIPDGPKGPNMKLSDSALYYALKTGKPIIGMTYSVKNSKLVTKSWDKMMLPPLFSKGIVAATKAFYLPKDLSKEQLHQYKVAIETALTELTWNIDKELGIPKIEQGTKAKEKKYKKQGTK